MFENRKRVQVYLWLLVTLSLKASFVVYLALLILAVELVMGIFEFLLLYHDSIDGLTQVLLAAVRLCCVLLWLILGHRL